MDCSFENDDLEKLETDPTFSGGYSDAVVRAFRMRMQQIRAAVDERTFYALKSLHFEKLKGKRSHQHSMKLNDQYRLILEIEPSGQAHKIKILNIEDYH